MIIVAIISTIALENYRTCVVNDMYFDRTRHLKRINQKKKTIVNGYRQIRSLLSKTLTKKLACSLSNSNNQLTI